MCRPSSGAASVKLSKGSTAAGSHANNPSSLWLLLDDALSASTIRPTPTSAAGFLASPSLALLFPSFSNAVFHVIFGSPVVSLERIAIRVSSKHSWRALHLLIAVPGPCLVPFESSLTRPAHEIPLWCSSAKCGP